MAICAFVALSAQTAMDPDNPTCPAKPGWGPSSRMTLTPQDVDGKRVLIAEGVVDASLPGRLRKAIEADEMIGEIWLRSRGGDAQAGNEAGRVIRSFPGCSPVSRQAGPAFPPAISYSWVATGVTSIRVASSWCTCLRTPRTVP